MSEINGLQDFTIFHLQYSSKQIAAAVGKSPIIALSEDGNQTWWIWDIGAMAYKDTGVVAYLGDINEAKAAADQAQVSAATAQNSASSADSAKTSAAASAAAAINALNEVKAIQESLEKMSAGGSTFQKLITGRLI